MKDKVIAAIAAAVVELYNIDVVVELERPDEKFGDWSTNVAMRLSKPLQQKPQEIAQEIVAQLEAQPEFSVVAVAGPGFINMTLSADALLKNLEVKPTKTLKDLKVLVEYSDPNPFKPLHAGHLYTTIVGDAIARLVERAGAETIRLNYGGDVGLHAAKSMWAIVRWLEGENVGKLYEIADKERPVWLGIRYVEGNDAYEENEQAKAEIIEVNKKIYALHNDGDRESPFAQIYWECRQWSYDYFAQLYEKLQVHPFDRFIPESEVTPMGYNSVIDQLDNGVFENSDGAVIFDGEKYGFHKRVFINSEGLPTYEAKDVGLSLTKWQDYRFDESIIITANEQSQYMQVVIKAIEQFEPEPAQKTRHLTHGLVKLAGGEKMSSRKGNVLLALDLLEAARVAGAERGNANNEETVLAAVKYAFLKNRMGGDIAYDPEESVATEGNSGPYLQYAHARARSILRKADSRRKAELDSLDESERSLVRELSKYHEVVELATSELAPHHICSYLYELAQNFNRFYEVTKVIGSEREPQRLMLVEHYANTLKKGLGLLGISAPDQM